MCKIIVFQTKNGKEYVWHLVAKTEKHEKNARYFAEKGLQKNIEFKMQYVVWFLNMKRENMLKERLNTGNISYIHNSLLKLIYS
jgi:hypothetical protein